MITRRITTQALLAGFFCTQLASAQVPQTEALRKQIDQALIEAYQAESTQSPVVERIEFLEREDTLQPIRIVHGRDLREKDRILVIAIDDGARDLLLDGGIDTVIIGIPMADRVKDLVPPVREDASEGSPAANNARITSPNSPAFIRFIRDEVLPFAEDNYGPFFHRVLFGYSLGGIFTLQTMMSDPQLFNAYVAGSPSLWYEYDYYRDITLKAAAHPETFRNRCLIMSAGEDEPSISTGARNYHRLLSGLDLPLITHYQRNAEIDHGHNRTISYIYAWDKMFNTDDSFPRGDAIAAETVTQFNDFLEGWLSRNSCVGMTLSRMAPAYANFASKLVAAQNWSEMRVLRAYVEDSESVESGSYGGILMTLLGGFKNYPEQEKAYWAEHYQRYMATHPRPGLAIHSVDRDVVDYLAR